MRYYIVAFLAAILLSSCGEYQRALQMLYGISFTIKMSPKSGYDIEGYTPYVVPPLEGFWTFPEPIDRLDPKRKAELEWISCIRLPEFVTPGVFDWAVQEATRKKKADFSKAEMITPATSSGVA